METIDILTDKMIEAIQSTPEYHEYCTSLEMLSEDELAKQLIQEYHSLLILQQAQTVQGIINDET